MASKSHLFKKGEPRPSKAGRRKGTPNKSTKAMKAMAMAALDGAGGQKYLEKVAKSDPKAFLGFIGKFVPAELKAQLEHLGVPSVEIRDYTGRGKG